MRTDDPRHILQRYGLSPRRSLGQNFLVDVSAPARIVAGAGVESADLVLEIGAGVGALTAALAEKAGRVLAVETDPHLVDVLHDEFDSQSNVTIIHGDILSLAPYELLEVPVPQGQPLWGRRLPHYRVVANLPYYITGAVMRHILESEIRPVCMVVTVQKEVALRMVAEPGDMSLLAVSVQFYGQPRILFRLKRGAFFPAPAVESAVVRLDLFDTPPVEVASITEFFRVVKAGFAQRRKQLRNTLANALRLPGDTVADALSNIGIAPTRRAETLSVTEWGSVYIALSPLIAGSEGRRLD